MKKRTIFTLAAIAFIGVAALWLLRSHQLELIHSIVLNAVMQKAPEDYPASRIRETFDQALRDAAADGGQDAYLEELLNLSRRLEKVQRLSAAELDEILAALATSGSRGGKSRVEGDPISPFKAVLPWLREVPPLSDGNQTGTLSRLRAYHPGPSCENPVGELESQPETGTDSVFDLHFPASSVGGRSGGLAVGAAQETPKARPRPRDHDEER